MSRLQRPIDATAEAIMGREWGEEVMTPRKAALALQCKSLINAAVAAVSAGG
ncbi:MAG TPA: hypothetical protein VK844_07750 [Hyphomicrobiales bacterium]|nr:hypothetical protein [Hyphomicrobiales bacterium]